MILGYTTGVFDLFHIGHLNLLRNAKAMCDRLVVGVTTDELMLEYKKKKSIIPFGERCEIIRAIKYVDAVVSQTTMDKMAAWRRLKFDMVFVGDDWFKSAKWEHVERELRNVSVRVVYFPYTKGISSTLLNKILEERRNGKVHDKNELFYLERIKNM